MPRLTLLIRLLESASALLSTTLMKNSKEIFPFLFRGGEARLELTDEEDLLETGVDIMARPPVRGFRTWIFCPAGKRHSQQWP